jgi:holo-[acyl-carrier protein] synthase
MRVGHDLQRIPDVAVGAGALSTEGLFTAHELEHIERARDPRQTLAGMFCAKEALFKCLGRGPAYHWSDMEVFHDEAGAPRFRFSGALAAHLTSRGWNASVSISHSGDYASAVVILFGTQYLARALEGAASAQGGD